MSASINPFRGGMRVNDVTATPYPIEESDVDSDGLLKGGNGVSLDMGVVEEFSCKWSCCGRLRGGSGGSGGGRREHTCGWMRGNAPLGIFCKRP